LNGDLQRDRPILILIAALAIFCPPTSPSERSPRPYVNGIAAKRHQRGHQRDAGQLCRAREQMSRNLLQWLLGIRIDVSPDRPHRRPNRSARARAITMRGPARSRHA